MAVVDAANSGGVTTVQVAATSDNDVQVSLSGDGPQLLQLNDVARAANDSVTSAMPIAERVNLVKDDIARRLRSDGLTVSDVPAADITLNFEVDFETGLTIGRQDTVDGLAPIHQERVQRDVQQAIARAFSQGAVDLTATIHDHVAKGDHAAAAQATSDACRNGALISANSALLDALMSIEVFGLSDALRDEVREIRVAVAARLNRYDIAELDARAVLKEQPGIREASRVSLESAIAIAAKQRGEVETAISIWRRLVKFPEALDPANRGWVWRNLSLALPIDEPEAVRAAKHSADAFLEAGDKRQAATSLMQLSHLLEHQKPADVIQQLDAMLALITQEGLIGDELRAAIHHARGDRMSELGQHRLALAAALEAVQQRKNVSGVENQLISSLHLAAIEAKALGDNDQADALDREALELETKVASPHFTLARRIAGLFESFDKPEAAAVTELAKTSSDPDLIVGAGVAVAMSDPELDTSARLSRLEALLNQLERGGGHKGAGHPAQVAIASVLYADREFDRAAIWLRRILVGHPLDRFARDRLVNCLWETEDWGEAAIFLKKQIDLHGEAPGLLWAYGRSLFEAGDLSGAIMELTKALKLVGDDREKRAKIEELRTRALDLGGTLVTPSQRVAASPPVLREELEIALKEFALFVSADKRMGFWTRGKADHEWVPHPEKRAQDLLHTFLKARFQQRISVFEELDTGAGRLDLLLKLDGGLSVIIELKMCGYGYSAAYAASGEGQIRHYMENRSAHLGYLVVHDARLNDFGSALLEGSETGQNTIYQIFVDLRPRVSQTQKRGLKAAQRPPGGART
jgi:tetratricopeptide (TPR) repeat protein